MAARSPRRDRNRLEEQFRQAQKMEAVGRLAGGVAHDFNNLLTVITGYSDMLLASRDLKESQRTALEEIRRPAERGARSPISCWRSAAASRSKRMVCHQRAGHADRKDAEAVDRRGHRAGDDPAAAQDVVEADPGRLEQVMMNLVVNARDAMPNGGKLTIETGTVQLEHFSAKQMGLPPGPYVTLSITDTGIGMDEATQSHMFEPFFTTKHPGRGDGVEGLRRYYGSSGRAAG